MKLQTGFSLIELMIVVVIVAILSAVAVPAYNSYSMRGKIPDATSNLAAKRVQMEQFYQDNRTYVAGTGCVVDTTSSKYFDFSCVAPDGVAPTTLVYTIKAVGKGSMTGFTYTINESNTKATTQAPGGWGPTSTSCWITKQGGGC